jgi:hypothetical protein
VDDAATGDAGMPAVAGNSEQPTSGDGTAARRPRRRRRRSGGNDAGAAATETSGN